MHTQYRRLGLQFPPTCICCHLFQCDVTSFGVTACLSFQDLKNPNYRRLIWCKLTRLWEFAWYKMVHWLCADYFAQTVWSKILYSGGTHEIYKCDVAFCRILCRKVNSPQDSGRSISDSIYKDINPSIRIGAWRKKNYNRSRKEKCDRKFFFFKKGQ